MGENVGGVVRRGKRVVEEELMDIRGEQEEAVAGSCTAKKSIAHFRKVSHSTLVQDPAMWIGRSQDAAGEGQGRCGWRMSHRSPLLAVHRHAMIPCPAQCRQHRLAWRWWRTRGCHPDGPAIVSGAVRIENESAVLDLH